MKNLTSTKAPYKFLTLHAALAAGSVLEVESIPGGIPGRRESNSAD